VADPAHRPVEQVARADRVELAEAQRVEDRDRPRAEREDVAQDAANPLPTSTAPAFSPGPITTRSPSVGSRRKSLRECL
jgi:hypothetical protein